MNTQRKELGADKGESSQTFFGMLGWVRRHRPPIIVQENPDPNPNPNPDPNPGPLPLSLTLTPSLSLRLPLSRRTCAARRGPT